MNKNKKVMLTLDENLYFLIKKKAEKNHVPLATYIKVCLVKMLEEGN